MGLMVFSNLNNVQIASQEELVEAKIYGKDISIVSEGYILEAYQYNNKIYIIRYERYIEE